MPVEKGCDKDFDKGSDRPCRIGAYIVALWLIGIIINLLILPGFYDIALRDLGLCLGAIALGRLSERFDRRTPAPDTKP